MATEQDGELEMTGSSNFISQRLEEAIRWHTRLTSGDEDERDWQEFTHWLEANPENRTAYDEVEEISSTMERLGIPKAAAEDPRVIRLHSKSASALRSPYVWFGSAMTLAAALLLVITLPRPQPSEAIYSTRVGEARTVRLADGSELDLNSATTIRALIESSQRQVVLMGGEVLFHVAKNAERPFHVVAGRQRLRVVGTVFDVLQTDRKLSVTVAEGRVLVSDAAANDRFLLMPGDQLVHRRETGTRITHVPPSTASAWRNGYLVYENATLADIADDLNRYFRRKVVIVDTATARQKFSGALRMDREEAVLNRLSHLLPIEAEYGSGHAILLRSSAVRD